MDDSEVPSNNSYTIPDDHTENVAGHVAGNSAALGRLKDASRYPQAAQVLLLRYQLSTTTSVGQAETPSLVRISSRTLAASAWPFISFMT
jgi:hypothetical protein